MIFVLGGATVLAAALVFGRRQPSRSDAAPDWARLMPLAQFPILAGLGALMAAAGWIGLTLANPLYAEVSAELSWPRIALNGLAGMAGGTLTAQLFTWFTTGRFDGLMGPRGALAGLIAVSAGAPFYPTWAALIIGAVAGLMLPLAIYAIEHGLHLDDVTAAIASYLLPGLWGLLAVGIFADGRWGQGWNDAGGLQGQGVSGLMVAQGFQADGGQLAAQVWGAIALFVLGFLLPWGLFKLVAWPLSLRMPAKTHASRQEYAVDNPGEIDPTGESRSTPGSPDRVGSADDGL